MDFRTFRTFLYLVLGLPLLTSALAVPPTAAAPPPTLKRHRPHARSLRSPHARRTLPTAAPPSFFVPSTAKLPLIALATRSSKDSDVHPQILLQQHVNRGIKRHTRMSKRALPADVDKQLAHRLKKRWETVQQISPSLEQSKQVKRWRAGEALAGATAAVQHMKDRVASILPSLSSHGHPSTGLAAQVSARVGVSGYAGANVAAARLSANASSSAAGRNETDAAEEQRGFSKIALAAATDNTIAQPENVTAANSLGLAIEANDVGYFAEIQLGSNNQTFKILMDSGSADFWVPSSLCDDCGNHTFLSPSSSSSFTDTGIPWSVTYGTGDVAGTTVVDDAFIAGMRISQLQFGAVTKESDDFSDPSVPFDGLMGLARSSLSSQGVPTPIERLAADGLVVSAQMGYKLGRVADGKNDGEVTFGGVDGSKFSGELVQVENVNEQGFWEATLEAVTVFNPSSSPSASPPSYTARATPSPSSSSSSSFSSASTSESSGTLLALPFSPSSPRTAILDTGTTLIIAPAPDAEALHRMIPGAKPDGQGGFTLPCTTRSSISLTFAGRAFPLNPRDLTFLPLTDDLDGECVSAISSGSVGGEGSGEWLVGAAFLKNVYFATDVASNTIGLAKLA
ncbi:hypothetical protein JCM10207_005502 [Rhodosporidiobolus poonsookiae]